MSDSVSMSLGLPKDVEAFIRRAAESEGTSVSGYVNAILRQSMEDSRRAKRSERDQRRYMVKLGVPAADIPGMTQLERSRRIVALAGGRP